MSKDSWCCDAHWLGVKTSLALGQSSRFRRCHNRDPVRIAGIPLCGIKVRRGRKHNNYNVKHTLLSPLRKQRDRTFLDQPKSNRGGNGIGKRLWSKTFSCHISSRLSCQQIVVVYNSRKRWFIFSDVILTPTSNSLAFGLKALKTDTRLVPLHPYHTIVRTYIQRIVSVETMLVRMLSDVLQLTRVNLQTPIDCKRKNRMRMQRAGLESYFPMFWTWSFNHVGRRKIKNANCLARINLLHVLQWNSVQKTWSALIITLYNLLCFTNGTEDRGLPLALVCSV